MKPCPYCAEQIQDAAAKCRFCGEWLDPSKRPDYAEAGTTSAQPPAPEVPAPTFNPPARSAAPAAVPTPAAWSHAQDRATDTPAPSMGVESPVLGGFEPPRAAAPARTEVAPAPAPARPAGPAAQSWSPPAWLAHEELEEAPARTGNTVVSEPSRASLEEVALRMQRIKASAAAVRQAVQEEARRRPHTQPPMPAARTIAPPPADPMDDDDPAEAATMVDGPRLDASIDRPRRLAEVPRHEPPVPPTSTASGAFDAMPSKGGFEDGFLGDLDGDEDDEFGDDEFGDDEEGDFGDAGDFGDVRASRPLPWKPIVVGAVVVLGIGLVAFWGRIFPDEAATQTTSEEQQADEDAATDEVAKSSVAPEKKAAEDPVPGEGQPVVPEGETPAAVGAAPEGEPNPATATGAVDPAAGAAPAGATPAGAMPAGATPAGATPAGATPAGAAPAAGATPMPAGAPLDPAMLQQLEEARAHYRKGGKKRLKDAQALLQTILSRAPMHPDALLVMAQVQLELGLPEDSLATATTCTQVAPEMADCWLTIGVLKQERKDGSAAADAYARYLELAPDGAYAGQVSKQLKRLRK